MSWCGRGSGRVWGPLRARRVATLRVSGAAVLLGLASGCSEPDATCSSEDVYTGAGTVLVDGPSVGGEVVLSAESTSFLTAFEVVLDQLPEVWVGDEPLWQPTLAIGFELEYPDPQPTGAELPEVTATLDTGRTATAAWYAARATAVLGGQRGAAGRASVAPFVVCSSSSMDECCPYGASSCSGRATLRLSRDADLFPQVRVRYTARPSARLYTCVHDDREAAWTIEEMGE